MYKMFIDLSIHWCAEPVRPWRHEGPSTGVRAEGRTGTDTTRTLVNALVKYLMENAIKYVLIFNAYVHRIVE